MKLEHLLKQPINTKVNRGGTQPDTPQETIDKIIELRLAGTLERIVIERLKVSRGLVQTTMKAYRDKKSALGEDPYEDYLYPPRRKG